MTITSKNGIFGSIIFLLTLPLPAEELSADLPNKIGETALHIMSYSEPTPKVRTLPKYPKEALINSREGWSKLSFIVETDGSVSNVIIADSSGSKDFDKESIKAAKKWQYEPALENGQPIQQCINSAMIKYEMNGGGERGVRRNFKSLYEKANKELRAKRFSEVVLHLQNLKKIRNKHLSESNFYHLLAARFYKTQGSRVKQIKHLKNIALEVGFSEEQKLGILLELFNAQVGENLFANSLNTYKSITNLPIAEQYLPSFSKTVANINKTIEGNKSIVINADIQKSDFWHHKLARKSFTLANINGSLHKLDVRCANKRHVYSVEANNTWTIPESWQHCSIFVYGDDNTNFDLIEINKTT